MSAMSTMAPVGAEFGTDISDEQPQMTQAPPQGLAKIPNELTSPYPPQQSALLHQQAQPQYQVSTGQPAKYSPQNFSFQQQQPSSTQGLNLNLSKNIYPLIPVGVSAFIGQSLPTPDYTVLKKYPVVYKSLLIAVVFLVLSHLRKIF